MYIIDSTLYKSLYLIRGRYAVTINVVRHQFQHSHPVICQKAAYGTHKAVCFHIIYRTFRVALNVFYDCIRRNASAFLNGAVIVHCIGYLYIATSRILHGACNYSLPRAKSASSCNTYIYGTLYILKISECPAHARRTPQAAHARNNKHIVTA